MEQIYKIRFNEEMAQLANQQNFALESWQNLLGSKLSNVIDEFLLKTGQSHLQEKFSTAFLKTETFLGSDWTSILEADKYDFLDVFNSQPNNAFSLSTLNSSKIVFNLANMNLRLQEIIFPLTCRISLHRSRMGQ